MIAPPANDRRGIPKKTSLTRARVKGGRVLAERRAINGTMLSAVQRHSNVTESYTADSRALCLPMRIHTYTYSYTANPLYQAHTLSDHPADTLTVYIFAQGLTSSQAQNGASAVMHPQKAICFSSVCLCYIPCLSGIAAHLFYISAAYTSKRKPHTSQFWASMGLFFIGIFGSPKRA